MTENPPGRHPKLRDLSDAIVRRRELRSAGITVVLTNGVFDLLHPGHLHYLAAAGRLGGALFVALNSDASVKRLKGPERPIQGELERAEAVGGVPEVDTVVIFRELRLSTEIRALQPDIYCKAGDYTLEKLDPGERAALEEVGAQIRFMPFLPGHSTTSIIAARRGMER